VIVSQNSFESLRKTVFLFVYNFHLDLLHSSLKRYKAIQTPVNKWHCTLLHVSIPKESSQGNSYKIFKTHHSLNGNEKHEEELLLKYFV